MTLSCINFYFSERNIARKNILPTKEEIKLYCNDQGDCAHILEKRVSWQYSYLVLLNLIAFVI
jgi:hypothetical protein